MTGRLAVIALVAAVTASGLAVLTVGARPASAAAPAAGTFVSVAPNRLLDIRISLGGTEPGPNGTVSLHVLGAGPVPGSGVSAVVLNVTVTSPTATGYIAPVGADGGVDLFNKSAGSTQLIAHVSGNYLSGVAAVPGAFTSTVPTRLLDTRNNTDGPPPAGALGTVALKVAGVGPVPASGIGAVVLNVTATAPTATGYITVCADGTTRPLPHPRPH